MTTVIENEELLVTIDSFGAEIKSVKDKKTGREYMWNADERYWKRTAPVLFPFVGSLKNKEFLYDGKAYPMGQHGFARDMEFSPVSFCSVNDGKNSSVEAWFSLSSDDSTYEKYPFAFTLEIGYKLNLRKLTVFWRVVNEDDKDMSFSIGGHPAFMCPIDGKGSQSDYDIVLDTDKDIVWSKLNEDGLVGTKGNILKNEGGKVKIDSHLFDEDALIIENDQAKQVSLEDPDGNIYLTVKFDAPLFGLWSPAKKNAPFVCIEPWYGRCDDKDFSGELFDREYANLLTPGEAFEKEYEISFL